MKNIYLLYILIQVLKGTSVKTYKDIATSSFIYCSLISALFSADFIL